MTSIPRFLVWAVAVLGTGCLALPVQEKGKQQNERLTRSPQFLPNAAFVGNFQGIPVFQQTPIFHHPVLIPDATLFGQQAFGPVELVQFQNPGLVQQGNNQLQARTGAVEQDAANLGLDQFQVNNFPQANIQVFPNSREIDTSNLGLNPSKPTRVIVQTVPVVVEILDKTTNNNNEPELPGTVRTTSSFGAHRFDLGQKKEVTESAKDNATEKPTPIVNAGKSAATENADTLPIPQALASLAAIGTPPSASVAVQTKEFVKSTPVSSTRTSAVAKALVTETTVTEKAITNQESFSARTGQVQIPGFVAVDNMEMVLGMIGSSVVPQEAAPVALKQSATTTEVPITEEPSAAEQIVLDIMSRLHNQQTEKASDTVETVTPISEDVPKLLSGEGIVTPVIMVLSPQAAADPDINAQVNATQPEFVIVLDESLGTSNNNTNEPQPKKMNVGELALKIASESTKVEVPKLKVNPSPKSAERTKNTEVVPVIDPLVDVNQNLISKRLGVASNNDVGIEHIFLKSSPGTATDNLVPSTVDTEKNTTQTTTVEDIMGSLRSQMIAMVSPSGTLILIPMVNLTTDTVTPNQDGVTLTTQEGIALSNLLAATETQKNVAQTSESITSTPQPTTITTNAPSTTASSTTNASPSTTAIPSTTAAPSTIASPELLAAPEAVTGLEKMIDAMKAVQNNISLSETPQRKSAIPEAPVTVTPTEVTDAANSTLLVKLEKVIETMEATLVNVTANNETAKVMTMIDEVISTMEESLVNVTAGKETELVPETMKALNQALTNMTNALEALQNVTSSPQPPQRQQVRVVGQIVSRNQVQAEAAPVSIRQFVTVPIAQSVDQSRSNPPPTLLANNVADQVSTILRSRISNGVTRGVAPQVPVNPGFNQRTGIPRQPNQPASLADQLGAEIAHHLIAIV